MAWPPKTNTFITISKHRVTSFTFDELKPVSFYRKIFIFPRTKCFVSKFLEIIWVFNAVVAKSHMIDKMIHKV